ncbi:MAG: preprotein translocase subunit SecE [Phycisphaerales bacterium]|nr:preprotein translocase subunit SecE [Phycisphaerales bacterium]
MMTAVLAGVIVAMSAAWAWVQTEALVELPTPTWEYTFFQSDRAPGAAPAAPITPGSTIILLAEKPGVDGLSRVGEAQVNEFRPGAEGLDMVVAKPKMDAGADPGEVSRIELRSGDALVLAGQVRSRTGVPIFQMLYLQAAIAGLILLVGCILVYGFVATRPKPVEFLIATDGEMKKVNWSTRKTIVDSTWVVIGACFLISSLLFLFDLFFSKFFKFIHVLQ